MLVGHGRDALVMLLAAPCLMGPLALNQFRKRRCHRWRH
jgi:hypothetical protein